jgi:hypothetical protein
MKTKKTTLRMETLEDRNMLSASPLGLAAPAPEPEPNDSLSYNYAGIEGSASAADADLYTRFGSRPVLAARQGNLPSPHLRQRLIVSDNAATGMQDTEEAETIDGLYVASVRDVVFSARGDIYAEHKVREADRYRPADDEIDLVGLADRYQVADDEVDLGGLNESTAVYKINSRARLIGLEIVG